MMAGPGTALPVFYRDWWLTAATGSAADWGMAEARDQEGNLLGVWPYCRRNRLFGLLKTLDKPPFTPFCGPVIFAAAHELKPDREISRQHRVLEELVAQLPSVAFARATSPYAITELWPLVKQGWQIRQHYSYRLRSDQLTIDELWERLSGRVRTDLRRAEAMPHAIRSVSDVQLFLELNRRVLSHRNAKIDFPAAAFTRLFAAANAHNSAKCWAYYDQNNRPLAVVWLPFDTESAYLIGAASDPEDRSEYKAMTKLIWHAVQWCVSAGLMFDFEGSDLPGVEEYYRSFGPEVGSYLEARWYRLP